MAEACHSDRLSHETEERRGEEAALEMARRVGT